MSDELVLADMEIERLRGEVVYLAAENGEVKEANAKLKAERDAAVARYEYVRRLSVPKFQELFVRCFKGERFDDLVDAAIDAARGEK